MTEVVFVKCNREVTWISRQRPCVYTRATEVEALLTSLACACCEVRIGITAFV